MNNKLKHCPFCGDELVKVKFDEDEGDHTLYSSDGNCFIECQNCGAKSKHYHREDDAVAAWNKRAYSWDMLMEILDEVYPADVFNGESGDVGSRIIMNLREIDLFRQEAKGEV